MERLLVGCRPVRRSKERATEIRLQVALSQISNGTDLEVVVSSLGLATQVSETERARAHRIAKGGVIDKSEIEFAAEKARTRKRHRVSYFLGVIEGRRQDAADEAERPTPARRSQAPPAAVGYHRGDTVHEDYEGPPPALE